MHNILYLFFYKAITPEAIVNGFISTGLCPWDREAPDYSKVEYSNNPVNDVAPLQGININGSVEMGVQTGTSIYINKQTQCNGAMITRDFLNHFHRDMDLRIPLVTSTKAKSTIYSWDDMIVDCHKYAGVREFVSNQHRIPRNYPKKPRGKAMKYVVFDNGGTKFPTGYYNKCGKF